MNPPTLLSVLIPGVPQHLPATVRLLNVLSAQNHPQVEVLLYYDNMKRPLGCKRNALMDQAQGKFLCHVDDDDLVSDDFISTLIPECEHDVDLIAYDADCSLNGSRPFRVFTGIGFDNEQPKHLLHGGYSDIKRTAWTWCLWRTSLARECRYPERYDPVEDASFLNQALPRVGSHRKVDKVLYHHFYSANGSAFSNPK